VSPLSASDSCRRAREALSRALDEELSPLEQRDLGRHLRDCPACRLYQARLLAISEALRTAPLEAPSVSLAPRLPRRRLLTPAHLPAAAAALVVLLGLGILQGSVGSGIYGAPGSTTTTLPTKSQASVASKATRNPYPYYRGARWSPAMIVSPTAAASKTSLSR
jgi:predicted anti-sigma-YlaC factor YlaD